MNGEGEDKQLEMLSSLSAYIESLKKIADDFESVMDRSDKECHEYLAALNINWLAKKYNNLWFKSTDVESYVKKYCENIKLFSSGEFELAIKHMLLIFDDDEYFLTKASHDQGVDLYHIRKEDLNFHVYSKTVVQCKLYRGYVPVSELRDFFGVMAANVAKGLFVTTGLLTSQGEKFVPLANQSPHANKLYVISRNEVDRLFEIAQNIASHILSFENDIDNDDDFSLWFDKYESLKASGRKLLWSESTFTVQNELF